jgi:hypothetical protein
MPLVLLPVSDSKTDDELMFLARALLPAVPNDDELSSAPGHPFALFLPRAIVLLFFFSSSSLSTKSSVNKFHLDPLSCASCVGSDLSDVDVEGNAPGARR